MSSYFKIAKKKFKKLKHKKDIIVLAIESSCDETSIAVVKNGMQVLSNIVSSQIDIHKKFGGVVPEIASRNHLIVIDDVLQEALETANVTLKQIDAIAVTYGAGLMGALLVGVTYAKSLAFALQIPLIKVNHIEAHISANYICNENLKPKFIALIVSGGHTALVLVENYSTFKLIGSTHDDAVGECFDKVAKVLGLGYPGGPIIDEIAKKGVACINFAKINNVNTSFDFSYSGLKSAVINYLHKAKQNKVEINVADVCASFEKTAIDVLIKKSILACKKFKINKLVIAGGVSANNYLRKNLKIECLENNIQLFMPQIKYCTDNASMVASEGYFKIRSGKNLANLKLTAEPGLNLKYSKKL